MSVQRGRDMLVKIKNESGSFITLAGLRTKTLRFNARTVDVTHNESLDMWRELLPGSGVKSAEITGAGIFTDGTSDALARQAFFEQSAEDYQLIIPDFGIIEGTFLISSITYAGTYQNEATYEVTLQSAGALSFEAIT